MPGGPTARFGEIFDPLRPSAAGGRHGDLGGCRDVRKSRDLDYPIFSVGHYMRIGKDRVEVAHLNEPVTVAEVLVAPGDIVFGEDDGVLVVPRGREAEVLRVAQAIEEAERQIITAVEAGRALREARKAFH